MRRPFRTDPPSGSILEINGDLMKQLRVESAIENDLIGSYVAAAVSMLDGYSGTLGRCILEQRWAFPAPLSGCDLCLPFPDCRAMTIERYDGADWSPVAGAAIAEGFDRIAITGLSADRSDIYVRLTAGWATPAEVPHNLKQAVRMLVAHWYRNREAALSGSVSSEVKLGVDMLLAPLRRF